MSHIDIRGLELAFDSAGRGVDTIVLVHGHPFDRTMWRPQIEAAVSCGWRVITPDLRGYGESAVKPGTVPFERFARDIVELLDALGIGRAVFGGLSMGGQVVMEICRLFPGRVRGVVLAATSPRAETDIGKIARRAMAERFLREGMGPYADEMLTKMIAPRNVAAMPQIAEHVLSMMRGTDPEGAAVAMRARADRPDYEATLAALRAPGLIVVGDEDAFTSRTDAERMHALLRGSELLWLDGCGHMPNLERTAEFNAAMQRFLVGVAKVERREPLEMS